MKQQLNKAFCLFVLLISCIALFTACYSIEGEKNAPESISDDKKEKIHEDINSDNINKVIVTGNVRSIIIEQGVNNNFEFYNADLNNNNEYDVNCERDDDIIKINILMKDPDSSNTILGSIVVSLPQKEFEIVKSAGDFNQVHFDTLNSDVFIQSINSLVVLNLTADQLNHNITLDGSFRSVSVYLDKLPDNINLNFNTIGDGKIYDPDSILKMDKLKFGTGEPIISINNTEEINFYLD